MAIDLTLEIEDVGPISQAKIDIGKINIIGGKNSTGKSTSSNYSCMDAAQSVRRFPGHVPARRGS